MSDVTVDGRGVSRHTDDYLTECQLDWLRRWWFAKRLSTLLPRIDGSARNGQCATTKRMREHAAQHWHVRRHTQYPTRVLERVLLIEAIR